MTNEIIILNNINITPLIKAQETFKKALPNIKSELERDGAIQRFEYTFELTWKTLKKILRFKGIEANSPRDVFREAAKNNLIDEPLIWFNFLQKRNLTSHTYNEEYAEEIVEILPIFEKEVDRIINNIKKI